MQLCLLFPNKTGDKPSKIGLLMSIEMNTKFTKQIKMYAPVKGCLTRWQHAFRLIGVVGVKT